MRLPYCPTCNVFHATGRCAEIAVSFILADITGEPSPGRFEVTMARAILTRLRTLGFVSPDAPSKGCPTCSGPIRETVGMVCQTCGTDYGTPDQPVGGRDE